MGVKLTGQRVERRRRVWGGDWEVGADLGRVGWIAGSLFRGGRG